MWARVARFEGTDAESVRKAAKEIEGSDGPPPGVPSTGYTLLLDPDSGANIAIGLFETEEDMKKGDETLNGMNPTDSGMRRTSVEYFEVPIDIRM
jgi:hypothetical protein